MKRVGLFGGTFDPIHLGHLATAISVREMAGLDEVWFVPAAQSPLKEGGAASAEHRRAMIEQMIEGVEGLKLCDVELQRPAPSYTVETARELLERFPDVQFSLMMSDDVARSLPRWREVHALLEMMPLIVSRRMGEERPTLEDSALDRLVEAGYLETPLFQVDATAIRERLREGKSCVHLLGRSVIEYIEQHHLYML